MHFRTKAIHIGQEPDPQTGAIILPLHLSSTFRQDVAGQWREYDYTRSGNPSRTQLETTIAALEEGSGSLAYSSGMAAIHGVFQLLKQGEHIIIAGDTYGGTYRLVHKVLSLVGIEATFVPNPEPENIVAAVQHNTRLVWIESIGNPLMQVSDIPALVEVCKKHQLLLGVDSTFTPPCLLQPLTLGADIVVHSATKFFGGHSDITGGVVTVKDQTLYDKLKFLQNATGSVMGSLECFLCSRGLKTLELRVREQCKTAQKLAEWLENHPAIEQVFYPGLASRPDHAIAKSILSNGFGSMMSFAVRGGKEAAKHVSGATKLFHLAVSLGAVESLIEVPAVMTHATFSKEDLAKHGITENLVRISVGIEAFEDLQADLEQAFHTLSSPSS